VVKKKRLVEWKKKKTMKTARNEKEKGEALESKNLWPGCPVYG